MTNRIRVFSPIFIFCVLLVLLFSSPSSAVVPTIHYVDFGGALGFHYSPSALTVEIGDTIVFRGDFATYPLVSTSVPVGALAFGPINTGTTFAYIVDVPGAYSYENKIYAALGMKGSFTGIRLPHGSLTNEGREFYLGMLYPTFNNVAQGYVPVFYHTYALITTYYANSVTVTYFDAGGVERSPTTTKMPARGTLQFPVDLASMRMDSFPDIPMFRSCHITSKYPITVQFLSVGANSGGSYLALPVLGLGKNYVAACYNDNAGNGALYSTSVAFPKTYDVAGGEFMVIATEDLTSVKITPNSTTTGGHVGFHTGTGAKNKAVPFTVGLSRGQCYLVRSNGKDASQDMSGSLIESNKPVAVIAGAEDATLGGTSPYVLDARDFMVEQMTPMEVWDTSGYLSIPLIEAIPYGAEGHGDSYRVYSFDTVGAKVQADVIGFGTYPMNTSRLASPAVEKFDITNPVDIYSTNGRKISVIQHEERSQSSKAPYNSPSMMTIVPHSRWRKAYNLSVLAPPTDHGATGYQYLDVLADSLSTIMVSANGAVEHPINTALVNVGSVNVVSKNYSVKAARFRIGSGPYYLHSDFPFAVYSYGMSEFWYFYDDKGNYEQFESEYAAPGGMQLNTGVTPSFIVTIDTVANCAGWNICVRDTSGGDPGIRAITLVDDSDAVYYGKIGAKYKNVTLDSTSLDFVSGELHPHVHSSQPYCFNVKIENRLAYASAPIGIMDNFGNGIFLRLSRTSPAYSVATSPIASIHPDSIVFPQQKVGNEVCTTFVFKNTGTAGSSDINFLSAKLRKGNQAFTIKSIAPSLPLIAKSQDSFKIDICFSAEDSLRHRDSLVITTDCFDIPITLDARSATGLINADNLDFGQLKVGSELCKNLLIHNAGSASFTLTKSWLLSDTVNFAIDPQSASALPVQILPSKNVLIKICFHPQMASKDSARIEWNTDIDSVYSDVLKDFSLLSGEGTQVIVGSVHSDPVTPSFEVRPNPAFGNSVLVTFSALQESKSTLNVFDVLGREVFKKDILSGTSQLEIPVRNLLPGVYYVRLTSESGVLTKKMEVVR